jgi:hypothetical protein
MGGKWTLGLSARRICIGALDGRGMAKKGGPEGQRFFIGIRTSTN